jgi:N-acetyl-gamma-glutamyl-phosphate reductase
MNAAGKHIETDTEGMLPVAVVGATGYAGFEAIRLLLGHPHATPVYLASRRDPQPHVAELWPSLASRIDMNCRPIDVAAIADAATAAICCLPHGVTQEYVAPLLAAGIRVIDVSADYRLKDPGTYETWYGKTHQDASNLKRAVYGLPELNRERIRTASLVANPGCYPTTAILAISPLLQAGLVELGSVIINAASGISGAGREPKPHLHFPEMNENFTPYSVGRHRHTPEIEQVLSESAGAPVTVLFTPHLLPVDRGILETIYLRSKKSVTAEQVAGVLGDAYGDEPFVRIRKGPPSIKAVANTNFCDLFGTVVGDHVVVFSVIDNLIKGASGQAVQNLNIMFGFPEEAGLL